MPDLPEPRRKGNAASLQPGYIWCRKCGAPVLVGEKCPLCRADSVPLPKGSSDA